jgi:hypothetical protein
MNSTHRSFMVCACAMLAASLLLFVGSALAVKPQQCGDPNYYCTAAGCKANAGTCVGSPNTYTATTVQSPLATLCGDGTVQNCANNQVNTCITIGYTANGTQTCGTKQCTLTSTATGCPNP